MTLHNADPTDILEHLHALMGGDNLWEYVEDRPLKDLKPGDPGFEYDGYRRRIPGSYTDIHIKILHLEERMRQWWIQNWTSNRKETVMKVRLEVLRTKKWYKLYIPASGEYVGRISLREWQSFGHPQYDRGARFVVSFESPTFDSCPAPGGVEAKTA